MSYRPQFAYPDAPEGCLDEEFIYVFDSSNVPVLGSLSLGPGDSVLHIPLPLDDDADFLWMGTKIDGTSLGIQFETPWTEPLSDTFVPAVLFAGEQVPTVLEAAILCPAGSIISLSLKNLT